MEQWSIADDFGLVRFKHSVFRDWYERKHVFLGNVFDNAMSIKAMVDSQTNLPQNWFNSILLWFQHYLHLLNIRHPLISFDILMIWNLKLWAVLLWIVSHCFGMADAVQPTDNGFKRQNPWGPKTCLKWHGLKIFLGFCRAYRLPFIYTYIIWKLYAFKTRIVAVLNQPQPTANHLANLSIQTCFGYDFNKAI